MPDWVSYNSGEHRTVPQTEVKPAARATSPSSGVTSYQRPEPEMVTEKPIPRYLHWHRNVGVTRKSVAADYLADFSLAAQEANGFVGRKMVFLPCEEYGVHMINRVNGNVMAGKQSYLGLHLVCSMNENEEINLSQTSFK